MGESLWHDLDAYQVDIIDTAMGQASAYSTLKLARVDTALVWDWKEWTEWPKPAVAVMSFAAERGPGPHGDGEVHFDKQYPTIWVALTEGAQSDAKRDAKILVKRMEQLLRGLYDNLTIDADESGERVVDWEVGRSELSATRIPDSGSGLWMVMAGIAIRWKTEE